MCTSGTAATNYLPAVAEASLAGTPLLVLTTDRPFELHYAKANQTLPQRDLFAPFAQATFEIPAPERQLFLHALLADLDQAVFEARRTARPVHLNMAYRKPFVDETFTIDSLPAGEAAALDRWLVRDQPYCEYLLPQLRLAAPDIQRIVERIAAATTSSAWPVLWRQPVTTAAAADAGDAPGGPAVRRYQLRPAL